MDSKQEALDFLESLKVSNEKVKPTVQHQSFKPMPRPSKPVASGVATNSSTNFASVTPINPITGLNTSKPGFSPGIPPQTTGIRPPPVTSIHQQKTKPTRVFQSFNSSTNTNTTQPVQQLEQSTFVPFESMGNQDHDSQKQKNQSPVQPQTVIPESEKDNNQINVGNHKDQIQQKSYQPEVVQSEWWGSLLNTAQKGLETARVIAKDTARVVKESQAVRDFGEKGILGFVAPEIEQDPNLKPVRLWFCPSYHLSLSEPLIRVCKQSVNESWRQNHKLFSSCTVNFVDDSEKFQILGTLDEAIAESEGKLEKLQKLSNGDISTPKPIDAYMTIQPFYTSLNSSLFGTTKVLQFWCSLVCEMDIGLIHATCISQSVAERGEGGDWVMEMSGKVMQTAISDLVDEFSRFRKTPLI